MIKQGSFFVSVCNFVVHDRCLKTVISPCSSIAASLIKNPVAHCWSEHGHHKRKFCNICRKRLDDSISIHCESKYGLMPPLYTAILTCIFLQYAIILYILSAKTLLWLIAKKMQRIYQARSYHGFDINIIGEKAIFQQIQNVPYVRKLVGLPNVLPDFDVNGVALPPTRSAVVTFLQSAHLVTWSQYIYHHMLLAYLARKCQWKRLLVSKCEGKKQCRVSIHAVSVMRMLIMLRFLIFSWYSYYS